MNVNVLKNQWVDASSGPYTNSTLKSVHLKNAHYPKRLNLDTNNKLITEKKELKVETKYLLKTPSVEVIKLK